MRWLLISAILFSGCAVRAARPDEVIPAFSHPEKSARDVPADPSPGCTDGEGSPQGFLSMYSGGWKRHYLLRLPPKSKRREPMPLVLNFPGWTETARVHEKYTFMTPAARSRGMVVVYPQGISESFNAGSCCGRAKNEKIDDIHFVRDLLARLERELCIDRNRIYATGISNGGMMSYRLACAMSNVFAAIAPVAGIQAVDSCKPKRPVSVLAFHGTWDPLVWYGGNRPGPFPPVKECLANWAKRDGCQAPPDAIIYKRGDATCRAAKRCAGGSDVVLCTITRGGHTWPGGAIAPPLGHTSGDIDATSTVLDFFLAHPKRSAPERRESP